MFRSIITASAFALAAVALAADTPAEEKKGGPVAEAFKAMQKEMSASLKALKKDGAKMDKQERKEYQKKRIETFETYGRKALMLAAEHPKDAESVDPLMFAMQAGADSVQAEAVGMIRKNFFDSEGLRKHIRSLTFSKEGETLLKDIAQDSKNRNVRGPAQFYMAHKILRDADSNEEDKDNKPLTLEEQRKVFATSEKKLLALKAQYGDVMIMNRKDELKESIGAAIDGDLFLIHNLTIGQMAPDIEGVMLDGKKMKLSDLRGKVVILDFWATWCGPCVGMIPHERKLVERLKGQPFAFVSVSVDQERKTLEEFLAENPMPWTNWWDGEDGPLARKYAVEFYPNIFVIDGKGVIRYKHVREEGMDKAVETLLKEVDKGGK